MGPGTGNVATWVGVERGWAAAHWPFSSWKPLPFAELSPHRRHIPPHPRTHVTHTPATSRSLYGQSSRHQAEIASPSLQYQNVSPF